MNKETEDFIKQVEQELANMPKKEREKMLNDIDRDILIYLNTDVWDDAQRLKDKKMIRDIIEENRS